MDWRQIRPDGMTVEASFPCRPASHARQVRLAGASVAMTLHACAVDGLTFGLAMAEVSDARQVDAALTELAEAAVRNISGSVGSDVPAEVPGMTPYVKARRLRLAGRLPDDRGVVEHAVFFAHGLRVYQATLVGSTPPLQVADMFFAGLRVRP